ncbi:unnamed protein product, partial [Closterium sp. Naga37s-1]
MRLPIAVTALLISTAVVLLLSSTPSQHSIPTLDLPRVQGRLPLAVTALLISTAVVLLLSSTPSQHGIPTFDLPRVQGSTAVQTSTPVQTDVPEPSDLHRAASDAGDLTELQSRRSPHPDSIKPTYPHQEEPEDSETDPWLESLCLGKQNKGCDPDPNAGNHLRSGSEGKGRVGRVRGVGGVQWVEPVGDEPQSEIEAIWAAHAAKHMLFGKVHRPRRPAEAREEAREEDVEDEVRHQENTEDQEQGGQEQEQEQEMGKAEEQEGRESEREDGGTEAEGNEPWRISSFSTHVGLSRDIRLSSSTKTPPTASAKKVPASPTSSAPSPSLSPPSPAPPPSLSPPPSTPLPSSSSSSPQPVASAPHSPKPSAQSPSAQVPSPSGADVCEGKCCSNAAPTLAPGVPKMTSLWLSSQLAHGARVIVRTKTWGTWWAAADGVNWEGRVGRVFSTPSASQALTIIRVSDTEFQFLTPSNTFLTKAPSMFLETTTNSSDPLTVFTIEYIPDTVYVVFKSSDGWYISQDGDKGPQFWWRGEPGDWERLDVREIMWVPAIRGANLGSWLMTEPWMNGEAFKFAGYGDGTRFTLRSVISGQYVTAPGGGGTIMTCNGSLNKDTYLHLTTVRNASSSTRRISVQWLQYWAVRDNSPNVWVQSTEPEGASSNFELFIFGTPLNASTERAEGWQSLSFPCLFQGAASNFELFIFGIPLNGSTEQRSGSVRVGTASNFELFIFGIPLNGSTEQRGSSVRVVLRAPNGLFVQANPDGSLTADLLDSLDNDAIWSSAAAFDLTVANPDGSLTADLMDSLDNDAIWSSAAAFDLTVLWRVEADWQAAYTAGVAAPSIYENIRRNFLKEADWQKMQELGINTVRIPLAYWIGLDASPEFPFVPGAATYLDWAFEMGRKYGVRIWFSVHVAPGSQAGKGNARDGLIRWRGANINRTLDFVTWLADRYGADPMWLGMGLLNEPVVPGANGYAGVDVEDMRGYYSAAFNAIRARCLCCFVAMEGRVGSNFGDVMWHMSDAWHNNVILEQHIYEVFGNFFSSQGVNFELDYAYTTRVNNIVSFQEKVGWQLLVGEFCNAMGNPATPEQQANFSLGQMKAFSHAKAG